jgi:ketosteroid isomerase-like protein
MAEHPNATRMRQGFEAFVAGDMATVADLIAEDAVYHIPGRRALAGTYSAREAFFGFVAEVIQRSEGTFTQEVHDVLATDDHVVVLTRVTARRGDRSYVDNNAWVFHMEGGRIVEAWLLAFDQHGAEDFFA